MSESAKAVFLSYASQDAEAAKRICEALRAAGVVVWFDQDALVGGDAWDTKIRGQISSCALFIPVVSANTQAREEGYFRLEWKLAEDRSHLMAKGKAFIVPVTVDGTTERGAEVPDAFLRVQWTKLPGGETSAAFVARVQKLLGGPVPPAAAPSAKPLPSWVTPVRKSSPLTWAVGSLGVVVLALLSYVMMRPGVKDAALARPVVEKKAAPVVSAISSKSIAVLPFANLSDDKDSRVFADGVHEDTLTNLSLIRDLHVVSRTSVEQYRDTKKPMRQIGAELGVAYLLEGSVRRASNTIRITGQLIRAATDEHLWAKKFDRELKDVFAIQAEIATEIAAALHAALLPREKQLISTAPTTSLDAYDLFLQARDIRNRRGDATGPISEQVQLLERAVTIDPRFGMAWARLVWARGFLASNSNRPDDSLAAGAQEALTKAEQLIPDTAELFLGRGYVSQYVKYDYSAALEDFRRAAVLTPGVAEVRQALARVYTHLGQWQKAIESYAEAERIEPANPLYPGNVSNLMLAGRRYAEAEAAARRALKLGRDADAMNLRLIELPLLARGERPSQAALQALTPAAQQYFAGLATLELPATGPPADASWRPGRAFTELLLPAFPLATQGKFAEVRSLLEPTIEQLKRRVQADAANPHRWSELSKVMALTGQREEALDCIRKAMELWPESKSRWFGPRFRVDYGFVLAWTGDVEGALREYKQVLQVPFHRINRLELNVHVMRHHPMFAPLRGHPGFEAMLNDPRNNAPLF